MLVYVWIGVAFVVGCFAGVWWARRNPAPRPPASGVSYVVLTVGPIEDQ